MPIVRLKAITMAISHHRRANAWLIPYTLNTRSLRQCIEQCAGAGPVGTAGAPVIMRGRTAVWRVRGTGFIKSPWVQKQGMGFCAQRVSRAPSSTGGAHWRANVMMPSSASILVPALLSTQGGISVRPACHGLW